MHATVWPLCCAVKTVSYNRPESDKLVAGSLASPLNMSSRPSRSKRSLRELAAVAQLISSERVAATNSALNRALQPAMVVAESVNQRLAHGLSTNDLRAGMLLEPLAKGKHSERVK